MRKSRRVELHLPVVAQVIPIAALGVVLIGCRFDLPSTGDDGGGGSIDAKWSFHTVYPAGQLSLPNPCPAGVNTVALHIQKLDVDNRPIGLEIIDQFDCDQFAGFSTPLAPGVYETFIVVTDGGSAVYATSLAEIVDVTTSDKPFMAKIVENGGYFHLGWELRRQATNTPIACRDLIVGKDRVRITATLITNTSIFVANGFDCEFPTLFGVFFAALSKGTYDVAVEPIDSTGVSIGPSVVLQDRVIVDRNSVTDLGIVTLSFP